jgi:hypothetical protein
MMNCGRRGSFHQKLKEVAPLRSLDPSFIEITDGDDGRRPERFASDRTVSRIGIEPPEDFVARFEADSQKGIRHNWGISADARR